MDDFVAVNGVYAKFFGNHKPARSAVEVARLPKDVLVEVEAIVRCVLAPLLFPRSFACSCLRVTLPLSFQLEVDTFPELPGEGWCL